ncbi:Peptidoglycan/xylan/chitin deacetylase, PgdA/CDA1 family, partial [Raineyella antarctica]
WENSFLGYPTVDQGCGLAQGGCYQHFQHGSIYWTASTGAHFVRGGIRDYWAASGWENGRYGYPKTDELCRTGTGGTLCRQDFQGGTIKWRSGIGIIDCSRLKCVALTFDGGPSPYTGELLDTLDARNVQVTFFVVGQYIDGNPAVVKRAHTNGNEVMNHSWSHPCLIDNCPSAPTQGPISSTEIRSQLERTSDKIQATVGERPTMLRPPFGEYDQRLLDISRAEGLAVVNWSADTIDWRDQNTAIIRERAVTKATSGGIILMHDTMPTTIAAVPGIISDLKARGYVLVTVGDVIGHPVPGVFYTHG